MKFLSLIILATSLLTNKIFQVTVQNADLIVGKWRISKLIEMTDGRNRKVSLKGYYREYTFFETGKFSLFSVNEYDEKLIANMTFGNWKIDGRNTKIYLTDLSTFPASRDIESKPPDKCWEIVEISKSEFIIQDSSYYSQIQYRSIFRRIKEK